MKILTALSLVLVAIGCTEFQQNQRNRAAQQYENLKFFIQDTDALAQLPQPTTQPSPWAALFNGTDLTGWKETDYAGRGNVKVENGELHIENGLVITGVTFTNSAVLPKTNYEISYQAKRVNGSDFFALLTFPVGDKHASFVTGGWGGAVTGISSINSMDASENDTTVYLKYNQDQWFTFRPSACG